MLLCSLLFFVPPFPCRFHEWKDEFKRRSEIENNWMNGRLRSYQLLNNSTDISHHGNLLAHVQFPKLIKCIHYEEGILATASNDNMIKLWDITLSPSSHSSVSPRDYPSSFSHPSTTPHEYTAHTTLSGHTSLIQHMQFHHGVLVSGSLDGIHVWNMEKEKCTKVIHENERCYQLQFEDELLVHGHTFGFKVWYVTKERGRKEGNREQKMKNEKWITKNEK